MCQEASKYIMTISEVSEKYGLTADTLRYYERIGLLPRVARKANGVRDYRQEDCQMIGFIKCLRGAGMPVDLLIQYFGLVKQGDATTRQRLEMLKSQREVLLNKRQDLEETLTRLEYKISLYDQKLREEPEERKEGET